MSQRKEKVETEMQTKTAPYQADKLEFIKNPIVAEFMVLSSNIDFSENELEQAIISHIQKFLMELGKGYAFVARQQHIRTELDDYFIPASNEPSAVLARAFGECREGRIPRSSAALQD